MSLGSTAQKTRERIEDPSCDLEKETALVVRVQGGDIDAFGDLMRLYVRDVRAYLALRAPARHLIDDVSHETFVVAYDKIANFRAGTSFRRWIRAIAWQLLRREVQKFSANESNQRRLADHLAAQRAKSAGPTSGTLDDLEHCLTRVPDPQRQLLDLKYREGRSTTEMADATGKSEDWVRTTLYRVRNQLRDCINLRKEIATQ